MQAHGYGVCVLLNNSLDKQGGERKEAEISLFTTE